MICPVCEGEGEVGRCADCAATGRLDDVTECPACDGTGHDLCDICMGVGEVEDAEEEEAA